MPRRGRSATCVESAATVPDASPPLVVDDDDAAAGGGGGGSGGGGSSMSRLRPSAAAAASAASVASAVARSAFPFAIILFCRVRSGFETTRYSNSSAIAAGIDARRKHAVYDFVIAMHNVVSMLPVTPPSVTRLCFRLYARPRHCVGERSARSASVGAARIPFPNLSRIRPVLTHHRHALAPNAPCTRLLAAIIGFTQTASVPPTRITAVRLYRRSLTTPLMIFEIRVANTAHASSTPMPRLDMPRVSLR
mmetsp:Transcript_9963/g.25273  ORF Transcript_9963/g.25273 Transcript_9963/m.25273 type:complete len:250 (-) Transcript_9963:682-1431(-)